MQTFTRVRAWSVSYINIMSHQTFAWICTWAWCDVVQLIIEVYPLSLIFKGDTIVGFIDVASFVRFVGVDVA